MAESLLVRKGGGGAKITGVETTLVVDTSETITSGDFVSAKPGNNIYTINTISKSYGGMAVVVYDVSKERSLVCAVQSSNMFLIDNKFNTITTGSYPRVGDDYPIQLDNSYFGGSYNSGSDTAVVWTFSIDNDTINPTRSISHANFSNVTIHNKVSIIPGHFFPFWSQSSSFTGERYSFSHNSPPVRRSSGVESGPGSQTMGKLGETIRTSHGIGYFVILNQAGTGFTINGYQMSNINISSQFNNQVNIFSAAASGDINTNVLQKVVQGNINSFILFYVSTANQLKAIHYSQFENWNVSNPVNTGSLNPSTTYTISTNVVIPSGTTGLTTVTIDAKKIDQKTILIAWIGTNQTGVMVKVIGHNQTNIPNALSNGNDTTTPPTFISAGTNIRAVAIKIIDDTTAALFLTTTSNTQIIKVIKMIDKVFKTKNGQILGVAKNSATAGQTATILIPE
jgi:hypothetical protein